MIGRNYFSQIALISCQYRIAMVMQNIYQYSWPGHSGYDQSGIFLA